MQIVYVLHELRMTHLLSNILPYLLNNILLNNAKKTINY